MAHHASAKKRHRQSLKRYARNHHWRKTCRNAVRKAREAALQNGDGAAELCQRAERLLRKASSKGVFHPRSVSRTVSRLQRALRAAP